MSSGGALDSVVVTLEEVFTVLGARRVPPGAGGSPVISSWSRSPSTRTPRGGDVDPKSVFVSE